MTRDWRSSWFGWVSSGPRFLVEAVAVACIGLSTTMACDGGPKRPSPPGIVCQARLGEIGARLELGRDVGWLEARAGTEFLLQVARSEFSSPGACLFLCPSDLVPKLHAEGGLPCSYRGPTLDVARAFLEGALPGTTVIASDACGDDGRERYHPEALCVLYASGVSDYILWRDLDLECNGRAWVGPDSPVARLRELIRK